MFREEADGGQLLLLPSVCRQPRGQDPPVGPRTGKDWAKPPSPGGIIQSCGRVSSQVQIYFLHSFPPQELLSSCPVPHVLLGIWVYNGVCKAISIHPDGQRNDRRGAASSAGVSGKQHHGLVTFAASELRQLKAVTKSKAHLKSLPLHVVRR